MKDNFFKYTLGFILLGIILISFYCSKLTVFVVSVFFIIITLDEYRNMFRTKGIYPFAFIPEIMGSVIAFSFLYPEIARNEILVFPSIIIGFIASFFLVIITKKKPYVLNALTTFAAVIFILCGLYIIKLTCFFEKNTAFLMILMYFAAVLSGDFVASIIGPLNKKRMLAPLISPNKTVLGAFVNLLCSCLVCLSGKFFMEISVINCLLLGAVISIFSQMGDLSISAIKRELDLKHSSDMFLSYGGILDRMDAFIFSAPAAYYFLNLIL